MNKSFFFFRGLLSDQLDVDIATAVLHHDQPRALANRPNQLARDHRVLIFVLAPLLLRARFLLLEAQARAADRPRFCEGAVGGPGLGVVRTRIVG